MTMLAVFILCFYMAGNAAAARLAKATSTGQAQDGKPRRATG